MHNRAWCYVTCNCQLKVWVYTHLDEYVKALFCMCPDIPPFLTSLEHTPICILFPDWWWAQAPFCTGQNHKETGSVKRGSQEGSWPLLWCWPASTSQESTIHCLFNKSSKKKFFFKFFKKVLLEL